MVGFFVVYFLRLCVHVVRRVVVNAVESRLLPETSCGEVQSGAAPNTWTLHSPIGVSDEVVQRQAMRAAKLRKAREIQRKQDLADRAALEQQRAAQRESDRKDRVRLKKLQKQAAAQEQADAAAAIATSTASSTGARSAKSRASAASAANAPAIAAKPARPPCACGCVDWQQHPFKKTDCANCFHPH
jgi:hypothetical protein